MKRKALALLLALCMALSMLPVSASAALPAQPRWEIYTGAEVILSPTLEPDEFEPMVACDGYDLEVYYTEGGTVYYEIGENVGYDFMLYTEPDEGYYLEGFYVEYDENAIYSPSVKYIGLGCYEGWMPDSDLKITAVFTKLSGPVRDIDLHIIGDENGGKAELSITQGQTYQTVYIYVEPAPYHRHTQTYGIYGDGERMDAWEGGGSVAEPKIVELVVPDSDMDVYVQFLRYGPYEIKTELFNDCGTISVPVEKAYYGEVVPITITPDPGYRVHYIELAGWGKDTASIAHAGGNTYNLTMGNGNMRIEVSFVENINPITVTAGAGGTAAANVASAKVGDTVTLTVTPDDNYRVDTITGVEGLVDNGDNTYTFTMPGKAVEINVTFKTIYNPITVTVENDLGGIADTDVAEAKAGDTVTLTCTPAEGYRVARITGADTTDNGDGTYTFTMPDEAVELNVLFLRHDNPFFDINETQFFYDSVLWAVKEGITSGISATEFGPFAVCNRAQVVTFLWRYAGSPEPESTDNPFTDVDPGWYEKAVLWAVEKGITNGVSDTEFGPDLACNRAQVVTFLWRLMGQPEPTLAENPFTDVEPGWYEKPVLWALEKGITTGATPDTFNPVGQCQRAQVVTFLYRTAQLPPPAPVVYALNARFDEAQGAVTLSHTEAQAGETITVTVTPNQGWQVESVACLGGTEVTKVSDTEYTFVMPEHEETVTVTFSAVEEEPTEPVKTYTLDVRTNINAEITYVDGKTAAAPGESIFFYVVPEDGYVLTGVGVFNPNNEIDVSKIQLMAYEDNLYELVMIDHDIILNFTFG